MKPIYVIIMLVALAVAGTAVTNGESAIAVGIQKSITETVTWNVGIASDFRGESVTVSAGIGWKF